MLIYAESPRNNNAHSVHIIQQHILNFKGWWMCSVPNLLSLDKGIIELGLLLVLTIALMFHGNGFQIPVWSQCGENGNVILCFLRKPHHSQGRALPHLYMVYPVCVAIISSEKIQGKTRKKVRQMHMVDNWSENTWHNFTKYVRYVQSFGLKTMKTESYDKVCHSGGH